MLRIRRWCLRSASVVGALAAGAAGIEGYARSARLDLHQYGMAIATTTPRPPARMGDVDLTGVTYLPSGFEVTARGFATAYGPCEPTPGVRTLLVLGDSTTVQSTARGVGTEIEHTWPLYLRERLGVDWQVCVLAANGYHPYDHATLTRALGAHLHADRTVALLCENDVGPLPPREVRAAGDKWAIVHAPPTHRVWKWGWSAGLYAHSEAYRYTTWRLALLTGEGNDRPSRLRPAETADALAALAPLDPLLVYLPRLGRPWGLPPEMAAAFGGVEVHVVPEPPDPEALRRQRGGDSHLREEGHRWVAEAVERLLHPEGYSRSTTTAVP